MADAQTLPPDAGTPLRGQIARWDRLWRGEYKYDRPSNSSDDRSVRDDRVNAAPGYSRSFARLIAGLFERQTPSYADDDTVSDPPLDPNDLSDLLSEVAAKGAGYGQVLIRPVYDGDLWVPAVLAPTNYAVEWAHRRPASVTVWDFARDPRKNDPKARLAFVERWEPNPDGPGTITTTVYEAEQHPSGKGTQLGKQIDTEQPPPALADHPFVVSAANDDVARDVFVFVWAWEDLGPVSLWYTNEGVIDGLARLWDQEQDDAELTRKRVAMPSDLVGTAEVLADGTQTVLARPGFNKQDNLLLLSSSMSAEHGPGGGVTPIEFDDDLVQRERIERRENALLEQVGINPASIGRNVGGRSDSAAAKRADNQMTMNTITGPARRLESCLSAAVTELGRLAQPVGWREWAVTVFEGLKENPAESADVAAALRNADAASTETLVRTAHPTWPEDDVTAEVERIRAEGGAFAPIE